MNRIYAFLLIILFSSALYIFTETPSATGEQKAVTLHGKGPLNDVVVINCTPEMAEKYNLKSTYSTVLVLAGTSASGVQKGDLIVEINGKEVRTVSDIEKIMAQPAGQFQQFQIAFVHNGRVTVMAVLK